MRGACSIIRARKRAGRGRFFGERSINAVMMLGEIGEIDAVLGKLLVVLGREHGRGQSDLVNDAPKFVTR